jgi:adenine-specific DNA methylase
MPASYPKRLIEVDLPIARISAHARREKSIRHGHISTLHIWWARRQLAACRAVICAALWPDPADPLCPPAFREAAVAAIRAFANRVFPPRLTTEGHELQETLSLESRGRWEAISGGTLTLDANEPVDMPILRMALLDFIADFANWDNSTVPAYLETSRTLTQAAHEAFGGTPGTRPLVVDPFAGGGSIPLEALRVGADAFATDLNPVAVLLNKVVLEQCESFVEIKGDKARLLPVAERTPYLFGKGTQAGTSGAGRKKKVQQKTLFAELDDAEAAEAGWSTLKGPPPGTTVLDRVHQAMILFAANRAELLKRFLVEDGVGKDARFWKLADNLNKLYPAGTDERRWIEGVLARKKGLGQ